MLAAPLGDDVFGDDPTVNKLEEVAASRLGKEASVFLPTGTMGNLIGIAVNSRSGEEVIADADSHVFLYEGAGPAAILGVQVRDLLLVARMLFFKLGHLFGLLLPLGLGLGKGVLESRYLLVAPVDFKRCLRRKATGR